MVAGNEVEIVIVEKFTYTGGSLAEVIRCIALIT